MITRNHAYMGEPIPGLMLQSVIQEHTLGGERRGKLRMAYENDREILGRSRGKGLPNNRLAHGFARYIVTMAAGYLLGKPVKYTADPDQKEALESVIDAYKRGNADSVDAEIAKKAAIYGVGVELLFSDENAYPKMVSLNPESAFVVYDDTVENKPLFGVRYAQRYNLMGHAEGFAVSVYTDRAVYDYQVPDLSAMASAAPIAQTPHYFGGVPMIEYWNGEDERGDFEQVQGLIDAYDVLQSDRVNDKQQFVDALLIIWGCNLEVDEQGRSPGKQLRQDKLLMLPDKECGAEYLARSLSESDVEVLKNALKADIHKFSLVPDLTDEQFAGNASGVAMKYKLLGLEQLMRIKDRWFREGLRERLRRVSYFLAMKGLPRLDADRVTMEIERALPVNELENAQTDLASAQAVQTYAGLVPEEILLSQVPFVEDVDKAIEMLSQQRQAEEQRQQAAFGLPSIPPGEDEA